MKKIRFGRMLLIVAFTSFTLLSCNKEDDPRTEEEPQPSSCRINTIYNNDGDVQMQFTYNEAGKVVKATQGGLTLNYQYNGNTIVIEGTNASGEFVSKSTWILNNQGFVTDVHSEHNETGTDWTDNQYEYEAGTRLIKHTSTNSTSGSQPFVETYTWANGNIVSVETGAGQITTYSYYTEMPKQPGDYFSYAELIGPGGAKVFATKNALKSYTLNSATTSFTYQTDDDGKIVGMRYKYGTDPSTKVGFGYECD